MDNKYVGKLFINEVKKDGKVYKKGDKFLRGTIHGKPVVGFLSKAGDSFNILPDEKSENNKGSKAPF